MNVENGADFMVFQMIGRGFFLWQPKVYEITPLSIFEDLFSKIVSFRPKCVLQFLKSRRPSHAFHKIRTC